MKESAERLRLQVLFVVPLYFGVPFLALTALAVVAVGPYGFVWMVYVVLPWFVVGAVITDVVLLLAKNQPWKGPYFDAAIATATGLVLGFFVLLGFLLAMIRWRGW